MDHSEAMLDGQREALNLRRAACESNRSKLVGRLADAAPADEELRSRSEEIAKIESKRKGIEESKSAARTKVIEAGEVHLSWWLKQTTIHRAGAACFIVFLAWFLAFVIGFSGGGLYFVVVASVSGAVVWFAAGTQGQGAGFGPTAASSPDRLAIAWWGDQDADGFSRPWALRVFIPWLLVILAATCLWFLAVALLGEGMKSILITGVSVVILWGLWASQAAERAFRVGSTSSDEMKVEAERVAEYDSQIATSGREIKRLKEEITSRKASALSSQQQIRQEIAAIEAEIKTIDEGLSALSFRSASGSAHAEVASTATLDAGSSDHSDSQRMIAESSDGGENSGTVPSAGRIRLNSATEGEMAGLPGVGPILAKKAIKFRETQRPFESVEDFATVLGLKPYVVDRMRALVETENVSQPATNVDVARGRVVDF